VDSYEVQPHQAARYKDDTGYQVFSELARGYTYIGYNNRRELFRDPRVRTALGMAINTDEIIEYVMYGEAKRITGPYPEQTPWYNHNVKPIPYDPQGALEALRELGWERNSQGWLEKQGKIFEFNLITNNGNPVRKEILAIAQNSWSKIGVRCNTQIFEWAVFLEDFINKLDFDAVVLGWGMGIDPDLYQIWSSKEAGPYRLNFVGYDNPRADTLIERIRKEYDVPTQVKLTHELHRIIALDQPYSFLFAPLATQVFDKKIVMVEDGVIKPIRPEKAGVQFHFTKWRKLESEPEFSVH
jgi:ABC-type transport system substrate-binding protein